eukprot:749120-Pleurochrysis_carterae.AAC.1
MEVTSQACKLPLRDQRIILSEEGLSVAVRAEQRTFGGGGAGGLGDGRGFFGSGSLTTASSTALGVLIRC